MNYNSLFKLCSCLTAEKFQTLYLSSEQTKLNIQIMMSHHENFAVKCNPNTSDEVLDWLSSEGISICSENNLTIRDCHSEDEYEEITESMNIPDVPLKPTFAQMCPVLNDEWNENEEEEEEEDEYWPKWCAYKPPPEIDLDEHVWFSNEEKM
jgi:hypothetical protein